MERLGIYIFVFFFLGICFFERVRTNGETGSLWRVLLRNLGIFLFAALAFVLTDHDLMHPANEGEGAWFRTLRSIFHFVPPYGENPAEARVQFFHRLWVECLRCATAALMVAAGIWELRFRFSMKWLLITLFTLVLYPLFGYALQEGFLGKMGYFDHAGALLVWALPAMFVLAVRLSSPALALPGERKHDMKGVKILPGMKQRFFLSRGLGFLMIFLVLNTPTLVNLPMEGSGPRTLWLISKTLTVIPASLTMMFCGMFFYGLFGSNRPERFTYAVPFFAVLAALVSTQSCNQYNVEQAIFASVAVTSTVLLYLRLAPLRVRFWDPLCAVPIFLVGGGMGVILASQMETVSLAVQLLALVLGLILSGGSGVLLTRGLMSMAWFRVAAEKKALEEAKAHEEAEAKALEEARVREDAEAAAREKGQARKEAKAKTREEARERKKAKAKARQEAKEKKKAAAKAPAKVARDAILSLDSDEKPTPQRRRFFWRRK